MAYYIKKVRSQVVKPVHGRSTRMQTAAHTPPFLHTSCDYFGPVKVKVGRNKATKHYGVIFTCLNTQAVHCEVATDASSVELLQVLRRFFAQRGYPKLLLSDNGKQMVRADGELCEMIEGKSAERVQCRQR